MKQITILLIIVLISALCYGEDTIQCKATRDTSLSFHHKEMDFKHGTSSTMKIKYYEEFGLIDFDVSSLKGKKIEEAYLNVQAAGGHKFNLNKGTDLKWLSISTVGNDWDEKKACANASGLRSDWGWAGAKTYDVAMGNGNTLRCNDTLEPAENGYHRIKLEPRLVQALVARASYGLFVGDGSTSYMMNCRIRARESGKGPYLEVVIDGNDTTPPGKPTDLKIIPAPNLATQDKGAVILTLKAPKEGFSFNITVNGTPIDRWQIPFAKPGAVQEFPILDLPEQTKIRIAVTAVDKSGNESRPASVSGKTSSKLTVPKLPVYGFVPKEGAPKSLGPAKVYAFPEITKINPVTGKVLHENAEDFSRKNPVWDGAQGLIRIAGARGEIVSFQIGIEGAIKSVKVSLSDLKGPGTISAKGVKLWRNWYVNKQSEYALPWKGSVDCPMEDNKITGQMHQAVTVDYHIPKETKKGIYTGKVTLKAAGQTADLALKVKVYDVVIPDEVHFNPEMNCYGGPGSAGSQKFKDSFKLAHYHRSTINRVPYSQRGHTDKDWTPDIDSKGHVTNWSRFDANLGGLLDGSWFMDNPRKGTPVPTLYLPHYEGWPLDFKKYYSPGEGVPMSAKTQDQRVMHHVLAKPIEEAMAEEYKKAWTTCVRDFYIHAQKKGWNRTVFECYLNNKHTYGYTMWTLDEPCIYRDWEALNFFGRLWKEGINDPEVYAWDWHKKYYSIGLEKLARKKPVFLFRGDISRPEWQGDLSDGLMNIIYLGGGGFNEFRMIQNHKKRIPSVMYAYGSCNKYTKSNWETVAWCLKAFAHECDGVLPWQSLGSGLNTPDKTGNSLIVDAGKYGHAIASFRVHAFRRGAQDCELLRLLQLKKGWSRQHIGVLVSQKIPLTSQYKQKFTDEAASLTFGRLTSRGFCEMKEGILQLLEK
ncbi:hypothetical protein ACFL6F_03235 [Planctomycetota bacterium]